MKKALTILFTLSFILFSSNIYAQHELWGMTYEGGGHKGVIFKTDSSGNNYSVEYMFETYERSPKGTLIKASNGNYYGMSEGGGFYGLGTIFEYNSATDSVNILHDFDGTATGAYPKGDLLEASNGKLYGMTYAGGSLNLGVAFEFDLSGPTFTKFHDFGNYPFGRHPHGSLIEASDGKLYGMTREGGDSGYGTGTILEIDLSGPTLTTSYSFNTGPDGNLPLGNLLEASNGILYGVTENGGLSAGTLFEYNTSTSTYTKLQDFDGNVTGAHPKGSLLEASNGKLYGLFSSGSGDAYLGGIFEYDITSDTLINRFNFGFTNTTGARPEYNNLVEGNPNIFFGMTNRGGLNDDGVIFKYNLSSGTHTTLYDFSFPVNNNLNVFGSLIESSPGKFLGMTYQGGTANVGAIFEYDTTTSTLSVNHSFDSYSPGQKPMGSLLAASNGKFYGLTSEGGAYNAGALFEYDPFTGTYKKWHDFDGTATGAIPNGSLIEASNGKLYGVTKWGGSTNWGALFEFDPLTGILTNVYDFIHPNGAWPVGGLMQASNGMLYGITSYGGPYNNYGVLFEYDPTGRGTYTVKVNFEHTTERNPEGRLIETSTGILYGLSKSGGTTSHGTLFEYNITGDSTTIKFDFINTPFGREPKGDLIKATNGKLYGMTSNGGTSGTSRGTLFEYDIPNDTLIIIHDFNVLNDGAYPNGSLIESSNGKFYGMTSYGGTAGSNDRGVLFEYDNGSSTYTKKVDLNDTLGQKPVYNSLIRILVHADWTGAIDSDWNKPGNWLQNDVPSAFTEVAIPDVSGTSGNFPVVSSNTRIREITVEPGATIDVQNGVTFEVTKE